jgi:ABC-type dipeptide/oligopeptide/nickel transport system permease component
MFLFVLRRVLLLPVVLMAISVVIIGLTQLLSLEERAQAFAENSAQLNNLEEVIVEKGLDQPFPVQYWNWLKEALQGNLGFSRASGQPVLETMLERFPATLELTLFAIFPVVGIGIWLGTVAALHKGRFTDQALKIIAITGYNLPAFMVAFYLMAVFYGGLKILPGIGNISNANELLFVIGDLKKVTGLMTVDTLLAGRFDVFLDVLRHLVLPVTTLVLVTCALILQTMRGSMIEMLSSDFVRTARAKGLSSQSVHLKHARRPALISVITLGGFLLSNLLTGSVLTETIFAYPGIGRWGAQAASTLDYAGILGFALFTATFVLFGNLLADILYALVDPRVRFE